MALGYGSKGHECHVDRVAERVQLTRALSPLLLLLFDVMDRRLRADVSGYASLAISHASNLLIRNTE